jgi:hypothetical protein
LEGVGEVAAGGEAASNCCLRLRQADREPVALSALSRAARRGMAAAGRLPGAAVGQLRGVRLQSGRPGGARVQWVRGVANKFAGLGREATLPAALPGQLLNGIFVRVIPHKFL